MALSKQALAALLAEKDKNPTGAPKSMPGLPKMPTFGGTEPKMTTPAIPKFGNLKKKLSY